MFIYADESGNSGKNIFDAQDTYRLGAIFSLSDIEAVASGVIAPFLSGATRLHAKDAGEEVVSKVCTALVEALDRTGPWEFRQTVIHKPYMATTKFVDTVFDSGENLAVPQMWYGMEYFRHDLCCAMDDVLTQRNKEAFWEAYLRDDIDGIRACIRTAKNYVHRHVSDVRMREVIADAFRFVLAHPEEFTLRAAITRKAHQPQTPNMAAFTTLLVAIHEFVEKHNSRPLAFIHDQQQEFKAAMVDAASMFGKVKMKDDPDGHFPAIEIASYEMPKLMMPSSRDSSALQAVDAILWILQREPRLPSATVVKRRLADRTVDFHISRKMSEAIVAARRWQIENKPISADKLAAGAELYAKFEQRRADRVREFEDDKRRRLAS